MPVERRTIDELVAEHRRTDHERIAAARRGQKPSHRCWDTVASYQSRMYRRYRGSNPRVREVFDGDPDR
jgi:hypothetical protein